MMPLKPSYGSIEMSSLWRLVIDVRDDISRFHGDSVIARDLPHDITAHLYLGKVSDGTISIAFCPPQLAFEIFYR